MTSFLQLSRPECDGCSSVPYFVFCCLVRLEVLCGCRVISRVPNGVFYLFFPLFLFGCSGVIAGAKITEYLLEKSRIVTHAAEERNYHVFYELLQGLRQEDKERYGLTVADNYFYLNQVITAALGLWRASVHCVCLVFVGVSFALCAELTPATVRRTARTPGFCLLRNYRFTFRAFSARSLIPFSSLACCRPVLIPELNSAAEAVCLRRVFMDFLSVFACPSSTCVECLLFLLLSRIFFLSFSRSLFHYGGGCFKTLGLFILMFLIIKQNDLSLTWDSSK